MLLTYQFKVMGNRGLGKIIEIYESVHKNLVDANCLWIKEGCKFPSDEYIQYVVSNTPIKHARKVKNPYAYLGYRCVDRINKHIQKQAVSILNDIYKSGGFDVYDISVFNQRAPGYFDYKRFSELNPPSLILYKDTLDIDKQRITFNAGLRLNIPNSQKHTEAISNFSFLRLTKCNGYILVGMVYRKKEEKKKRKQTIVASIDLGMNNLVSLVTPKGCVLFSGAFLNAYHRSFIKKRDMLLDAYRLQGINVQTKRFDKLMLDRRLYIRDAFHKISKRIVNIILEECVDSLVVGYNAGWKRSIRMNAITKELFALIPFRELIDKIKYKCEMNGINVFEVDESYTSKCDALAFEPIRHASDYFGCRIRRGLFQSCTGKLINADHNGALNIMRLKFGNSLVREIINNGHQLCPVKIRNPFV